MNIYSFKSSLREISGVDENGRNIGYSVFQDVCIVGRNHFYPNVLLVETSGKAIATFAKVTSPYDEKIMSLNREAFYDDNLYYFTPDDQLSNKVICVNVPVFFFIYNFDNYYHFLYDTIPYLYTFNKIKRFVPDLKLLVNYPNFCKTNFYKFNIELLEKYVSREDWILHNSSNIYHTLYVSSSLTHSGFSNVYPRKEIFNLYKSISISIAHSINATKYDYIYISRRTWLNQDTSNIGTNYTTRRKMINEDELVAKLVSLNFREVFAENLSTDEKIDLFRNTKIVVGSIGGGMSNLLFSSEKTKSIVIVTPDFLEVNYRFKYAMEHTDITYFYDVYSHRDKNEIPLFTRVNVEGHIGEIVEYDTETGKYLVNISNNEVAGFNNDIPFRQNYYSREEMVLLDRGLNSPYVVDSDKLCELIKCVL